MKDFNAMKDSILSFIKTKENSFFVVHDIVCLKWLTQLKFGFSHLNKNTFLHNFKNTANPVCFCGTEIESAEHCLLCCQDQSSLRYF